MPATTTGTHFVELLLCDTYMTLRAEAARTYISFLWWFIEPMIFLLVFYLVFGLLLERFSPDFIPQILVGLVTFRWFSNTLGRGSKSIIGGRGLMRQVYVPKILFPSVLILANTFKFAIVFVVLLLSFLVYGIPATWTFAAIPILLLTQFLFITGCTFMAAAVVPFLPDLKYLIDNALTVMFFLSGVFFSLRRIPEQYQEYVFLNPMAALIDAYRGALLGSVWPEWGRLAAIVLSSAIMIAVGAYIIHRCDRAYPRAILQ
jgi:lipopolysaccharide transport system permease protein